MASHHSNTIYIHKTIHTISDTISIIQFSLNFGHVVQVFIKPTVQVDGLTLVYTLNIHGQPVFYGANDQNLSFDQNIYLLFSVNFSYIYLLNYLDILEFNFGLEPDGVAHQLHYKWSCVNVCSESLYC